MKRIALAAIAAVVFSSCEPGIRRVVVLTFNEAADLVTISARTVLGNAKPGTPEAAQIDDEREALLGGRDEWSVRFANADPESDRVVLERSRGVLQSLEHIASIAPENLQKFFFDTHLTITFARGEGWAELTIYPGSSDRATRRQREHVERMLDIYSQRSAHYFQTVRGMYAYLDSKPRRAEDVFIALFREENDPPARISDDEEKIVKGVREAMEALAANEGDTATLDREFDLVFDPFPAEMRVSVPGEIKELEGFTRMPDRSVLAKMPSALEAVASLEGRWISPDPLAAALAATKDTNVPALLAASQRRAEPVVTSSDIAAALMEKMRPAPRYRVRWIIRPAVSPSRPPAPHPGSSEGGHTSR